MNEERMPLEEFVKLDTTVDFQIINSPRFRDYAKDKPYLYFGTELANNYIIVYTDEKYIKGLLMDLGSDFLSFYPKILSPLDSVGNEAGGITRVLNQPFLDLSGQGTIVGIVDTGIDYTKDAFRFEDGSTKILHLWDQTIDGKRSEGLYFGSDYDRRDIDRALQSGDPRSIVPQRDEDGHGTFLASVAAANVSGQYAGAAPKADIIAVKLRRARNYYIRRYLLSPDDPNLYESSDFLLGIKYVLDRAYELKKPAVICVGMGSNTSAHDGNTLFEDYISFVSRRAGIAFVTAAGNEANARHHTQGKLPSSQSAEPVSIKVGRQGASFSVIIFGAAYDKLSVGVVSPTGEAVGRIPFRSGLEYEEKLVMEDTRIMVRYFKDVNNNIMVGFDRATEGIWDINIYGDSVIDGSYWAWLPITGQVSDSVEFLRPVPDSTIVYPAAASRAITVGAYNTQDGSLSVSSSWGPTRQPRIAPDLVAPGVGVSGIYPSGFGTMTGTSAAAAIVAGASALLLEWGIVKGNMPAINGDLIKSLLITGCRRDDAMIYPNNKWGFGKLDLYSSFSSLRETAATYTFS